jgi:hypothetical protein
MHDLEVEPIVTKLLVNNSDALSRYVQHLKDINVTYIVSGDVVVFEATTQSWFESIYDQGDVLLLDEQHTQLEATAYDKELLCQA